MQPQKNDNLSELKALDTTKAERKERARQDLLWHLDRDADGVVALSDWAAFLKGLGCSADAAGSWQTITELCGVQADAARDVTLTGADLEHMYESLGYDEADLKAAQGLLCDKLRGMQGRAFQEGGEGAGLPFEQYAARVLGLRLPAAKATEFMGNGAGNGNGHAAPNARVEGMLDGDADSLAADLPVAGGHVLDLTGSHAVAAALERQGAARVVVVTPDAAKGAADAGPVTVLCGSWERLAAVLLAHLPCIFITSPTDLEQGCFDAAVADGRLLGAATGMQQVYTVLKPGGWLSLTLAQQELVAGLQLLRASGFTLAPQVADCRAAGRVRVRAQKPLLWEAPAVVEATRAITWSCLVDEQALTFKVPSEVMDELSTAAISLAAAGISHEAVTPEQAGPLPLTAAFGRAIAARLMGPPGVAVVKLDLEALGCKDGEGDAEGENAAIMAYWLLNTAIGAVVRSPQGNRLYEVRDRKLDVNKDNVFFSMTAGPAWWHTDSGHAREAVVDLFGLLCVRPASGTGGELRLSNAANAFFRLRERLPACLTYELERDIIADLIQGGAGTEEDSLRQAGRAPELMALRVRANRYPVIRHVPATGQLSMKYTRHWVKTGHDKAGVPVSPLLTLALDLLDAELEAGRQFDRRLTPGEIIYVNNHSIVHARAGFTERSDARGRLMVRAWMNAFGRPTLPSCE